MDWSSDCHFLKLGISIWSIKNLHTSWIISLFGTLPAFSVFRVSIKVGHTSAFSILINFLFIVTSYAVSIFIFLLVLLALALPSSAIEFLIPWAHNALFFVFLCTLNTLTFLVSWVVFFVLSTNWALTLNPHISWPALARRLQKSFFVIPPSIAIIPIVTIVTIVAIVAIAIVPIDNHNSRAAWSNFDLINTTPAPCLCALTFKINTVGGWADTPPILTSYIVSGANTISKRVLLSSLCAYITRSVFWSGTSWAVWVAGLAIWSLAF